VARTLWRAEQGADAVERSKRCRGWKRRQARRRDFIPWRLEIFSPWAAAGWRWRRAQEKSEGEEEERLKIGTAGDIFSFFLISFSYFNDKSQMFLDRDF
jgi:hypothetical protein